MDQNEFHVLLEGRKVGPYGRRTIVGMRIKDALTSEHVLIGTDGVQLTVGDLIGKPPADNFSATRSGVYSVVQATYTAALLDVQGAGIAIPKFKDEVELRVQADVLRLAGRFSQGLGTKEGRVKLPLSEIVHTRTTGSRVQLWLKDGQSQKMQSLTLELFSRESAKELVGWMPAATEFPEPVVAAAAGAPRADGVAPLGLSVAIAAIALVLGVVLVVLLWPRV